MDKKEYNQQYYQSHKSEILRQKKEYYQNHKSEKAEYYQSHRSERIEYDKQYNPQYRQTPFGRATKIASSNRADDRKRGFDTSQNIDAQWIVDNVYSGQSCIYCGETDFMKLGVDRIDNSLPHIPSNCVPCCTECNKLRSDLRTMEEHIEYMKNRK